MKTETETNKEENAHSKEHTKALAEMRTAHNAIFAMLREELTYFDVNALEQQLDIIGYNMEQLEVLK